MKQDVNQPVKGFQGLGIAPQIMARLGSLRFTEPTPIQEQAIPHAINGKDVVGIAQTGTGKTLAFGIPMIQPSAARSAASSSCRRGNSPSRWKKRSTMSVQASGCARPSS